MFCGLTFSANANYLREQERELCPLDVESKSKRTEKNCIDWL